MRVIEVISPINRGGFGEIEMVRCNDGNMYARKTFSPLNSFNLSPELIDKFRERFKREVATQMAMPQDLFIPIYHADLKGDSPWFIMPIAEKVYVNEIEESKIQNKIPNGLSDILNSMEFMHNAGMVHRDLKPHNILLHDGKWKLSDFGLISQSKEITALSITSTGENPRTERYCSPEQLVNFKRVTFKADIYSFGAILHDIFSDKGRVPYSELSAEGEIGLIIEKCTKKDPELRFSNVAALRESLLSVLSKEEGVVLNKDEEQISAQLKLIGSWNVDEFESFLFYIKRFDYKEFNVFVEFNLEILTKFKELNNTLFNEVSLMYAEWVVVNGFRFDYADVVVNHLEFIYNSTSDNEVKTLIALAAARLGKRHNRWYVMHRVIKMCDKSISDSLAFRLALEIGLNEVAKADLIRCAEQIHFSIDAYHPKVKAALE